MREITYESEGGGNLGFMLVWQSIDGRLKVEYYGIYEDALSHSRHLKRLGRSPQIWHRVLSNGEDDV